MTRSAFIIGVSLGLLLVFLKTLDYFLIVNVFSFQFYAGLIGLVFLGMGVWAGQKLSKRKNTISEASASIEEGFKYGLSQRELDVLSELVNGLSNQEIANKLFVSLNTIKTHISNIYLKLHVKRRTQAISKAKELKIIA